MEISILIDKKTYNLLKAHLFKSKKEEAAFLFAKYFTNKTDIIISVKNIHFIKDNCWDYQSGSYLELNEKEKIKIMRIARKYDYDLIECHSHLSQIAEFSNSDLIGLNEFVKYVWWKLPNKLYGAFVWTKADLKGLFWFPKNNKSMYLNKLIFIEEKGFIRISGKSLHFKKLDNNYRGKSKYVC